MERADRFLPMEKTGACIRCGRAIADCDEDLVDYVCAGCLTLSEDVAETAAFAVACYRAATLSSSSQRARQAQRWVELALTNLVRRHSANFANPRGGGE